jgi:hypothetical protein
VGGVIALDVAPALYPSRVVGDGTARRHAAALRKIRQAIEEDWWTCAELARIIGYRPKCISRSLREISEDTVIFSRKSDLDMRIREYRILPQAYAVTRCEW